jgi:hypothetical protein
VSTGKVTAAMVLSAREAAGGPACRHVWNQYVHMGDLLRTSLNILHTHGGGLIG